MNSILKKNKFFKLSIEKKFAFFLFIIISLIGLTFTYNNYYHQKEALDNRLRYKATSLINLLEASITESFGELKIDQPKLFMLYIKEQSEVVYTYLFDADGNFITDGDRIFSTDRMHIDKESVRKGLVATDILFIEDENRIDVFKPIFQSGSKIGLTVIGFSKDSIKNELLEAREQNLIFSILFVIGSLIISYFASLLITRPLLTLTQKIRNVGEGNYGTTVEIASSDEVGELAAAFNNMSVNIMQKQKEILVEKEWAQKYLDIARVILIIINKDGKVDLINKMGCDLLGCCKEDLIGKMYFDYVAPEDLEQIESYFSDAMTGKTELPEYGETYVMGCGNKKRLIGWHSVLIKDKDGNILGLLGSGEDITEIRQYQHELISAKEKAELSDKLKTEFLAQMSHEIRTPINIIVNYAGLIRDEEEIKLSNDSVQLFDSIDLASTRLLKTIDSILNMAQLQTKNYQSAFKELDVEKEIIKKLLKEFNEKAQRKNLKLIYNSLTESTLITADEYSVTQVLANLIDNAIKYTNEGKIELTLMRNTSNNLQAIISDTGIGISDNFLPNIFDPFRQEEQGYNRKFSGNGLGLALVKKYCEINNANIIVSSKKDEGTTFIVTFANNKFV
ncbi:MAG: ATP-binding protein [bacterium]